MFPKVLNPRSVLGTHNRKDLWPDNPAADLSPDNLYRSYDFPVERKDIIFKQADKQLDKTYSRARATIVFYDVSNVCFESPLTDAEMELQVPDFEQNVLALAAQIRGPSKEHCSDLPPVSIALVIDGYDFPMDFELYAGSASEYKTMRKSIRSLKTKYGITDSVVVADRRLNSVKNPTMLTEENAGFPVCRRQER